MIEAGTAIPVAVSVVAIAVVPIIVVPEMPGIIVPGIIIPGVPGPAGAVVPGAPAPVVTVIMPGAEVPGPIVPGIVIPGIPGPAGAIVPGIIPRPGRQRGIHDGQYGAVVTEPYLGAGGNDEGVTFTENIRGRLFAHCKEIVHFFAGHGHCLRRGGCHRRTRVQAVVIDLRLKTGHGRTGKGGKCCKGI